MVLSRPAASKAVSTVSFSDPIAHVVLAGRPRVSYARSTSTPSGATVFQSCPVPVLATFHIPREITWMARAREPGPATAFVVEPVP